MFLAFFESDEKQPIPFLVVARRQSTSHEIGQLFFLASQLDARDRRFLLRLTRMLLEQGGMVWVFKIPKAGGAPAPRQAAATPAADTRVAATH